MDHRDEMSRGLPSRILQRGAKAKRRPRRQGYGNAREAWQEIGWPTFVACEPDRRAARGGPLVHEVIIVTFWLAVAGRWPPPPHARFRGLVDPEWYLSRPSVGPLPFSPLSPPAFPVPIFWPIAHLQFADPTRSPSFPISGPVPGIRRVSPLPPHYLARSYGAATQDHQKCVRRRMFPSTREVLSPSPAPLGRPSSIGAAVALRLTVGRRRRSQASRRRRRRRARLA